jgi:predicted DNA-binding transcriptional regulator AlpA
MNEIIKGGDFMKEQLLRIEEVALLVGASTQTINNWYRWKKTNPEHELAKLLPDYIQNGSRQIRFWKKSDIWGIVEFKNSIPHGRNGILGEITQTQYRRKETYEKSTTA